MAAFELISFQTFPGGFNYSGFCRITPSFNSVFLTAAAGSFEHPLSKPSEQRSVMQQSNSLMNNCKWNMSNNRYIYLSAV